MFFLGGHAGEPATQTQLIVTLACVGVASLIFLAFMVYAWSLGRIKADEPVGQDDEEF